MILCRLCTTHGPEIGACQAVKVQATHSNAVPGPKNCYRTFEILKRTHVLVRSAATCWNFYFADLAKKLDSPVFVKNLGLMLDALE